MAYVSYLHENWCKSSRNPGVKRSFQQHNMILKLFVFLAAISIATANPDQGPTDQGSPNSETVNYSNFRPSNCICSLLQDIGCDESWTCRNCTGDATSKNNNTCNKCTCPYKREFSSRLNCTCSPANNGTVLDFHKSLNDIQAQLKSQRDLVQEIVKIIGNAKTNYGTTTDDNDNGVRSTTTHSLTTGTSLTPGTTKPRIPEIPKTNTNKPQDQKSTEKHDGESPFNRPENHRIKRKRQGRLGPLPIFIITVMSMAFLMSIMMLAFKLLGKFSRDTVL